MKKFLSIMIADYKADGFTGKEIAVGAIIPVVMLVACLAAEYVNRL